MPIVVDEVVISVEVTGASSGGGASGAGGDGSGERQAIVEECVERVLEILRRKEER